MSSKQNFIPKLTLRWVYSVKDAMRRKKGRESWCILTSVLLSHHMIRLACFDVAKTLPSTRTQTKHTFFSPSCYSKNLTDFVFLSFLSPVTPSLLRRNFWKNDDNCMIRRQGGKRYIFLIRIAPFLVSPPFLLTTMMFLLRSLLPLSCCFMLCYSILFLSLFKRLIDIGTTWFTHSFLVYALLLYFASKAYYRYVVTTINRVPILTSQHCRKRST